VRVQPFESSHLSQPLDLVNLHLGAVVPGWALSGGFSPSTWSATVPSPSQTRGSKSGRPCAPSLEVVVSLPPRTCCATEMEKRWASATGSR